MNIAIFTNNYLPNPYGVTGSVESFRRELTKAGHLVYIFAPRWPDYVDQNSRVFRYPSLDLKLKIRFPIPIPYSRKIDKILENLEIDVIHSQHPNLLGSAAMKWARRLARRRGGKKIPLIFTWHTLYDHYAHFAKFVPEKLAAGYMIKKAVRYANQSDAVIVPTDSIIPIIDKWGVKNENIFSVATGIEKEDFENPNKEAIRSKYGIEKNEIVLLLVSRLTSEKNIEFVFRAVFPILKNNSKIKFLVSGGGDLISRLKELVQKEQLDRQVIIAGVVERKELKNYFAAGDIFVYGSKSETQGMVVSEAMYLGLPVVAVAATGVSSLVKDGESGILVSENEKEFAAAVEKLIANESLRRKMGEVGQEIARANFTSEICAKKLLEVYEKCRNH